MKKPAVIRMIQVALSAIFNEDSSTVFSTKPVIGRDSNNTEPIKPIQAAFLLSSSLFEKASIQKASMNKGKNTKNSQCFN